ncbi:hypothetical protein N7532_004997 [Penicillium argentinense]|uniref:AAA+ ATPase domain-containing protein n=1 Tax=Penicillium argentinense TaxID=1131581 RepID=A0A9W9K9Y1_9EURO|nr:uncharacterized protein N7532_004997 [Penicillium argentinense]KAJ5097996.1 hypothetical protein N7532_004997 [Penicillium argentinense]
MGHGQQQAVHPFFRQEFGVSAQPTPSLSGKATVSSANDALGPEAAPSGNHSFPSRLLPGKSPTSGPGQQDTNTAELSSAEEDPNTDRRKRRRTEKHKQPHGDIPIKTGLASWLGKDLSTSVASAEDEHVPTTTSTGAPDQCSSGPDLKREAQPEGESDKKRKTLKLNSNGRLLSSPPATAAENTTQKRPGGKRGRPLRNESKLAILKYSVSGDRNIGRMIDGILSGQTTHKPAPASRAIDVAPKENKPAKPTHPFFLKKPTQGIQPEKGSGAQAETERVTSNPTTTPAPPISSVPKRELRAFGSFPSTFGRRTTNFPELLDPLWPPQDLVHIKSIDPPQQTYDSTLKSLEEDQKKSKLPVITVNDDENAFLVSTLRARQAAALSACEGSNPRPTLRIPGRHVASGRVLQTAIDSQMSWATNPRLAGNSSIPLISNLRESLLSSFSAFDCGKYEPQLWTHKYAPRKAEDVLQNGREAHVLRDWLRHHKITAVDTGKLSRSTKSKSKSEKKRKKGRKQADKLDGFIVSSEEEASEMDNLSGSDDELAGDVTVSGQKTVIRTGDLASSGSHGERNRFTNAILLSGPPGVGKTASVYAVAKELDFEVFEINPGSRRSARDMLEKVGDMTRNHLVHLLNESDDTPKPRESGAQADEAKQDKLLSFFKGKPSSDLRPPADTNSANSTPRTDTDEKRAREQKQSLILLEEADLLFDEDKQFWTGVMALISQSRRPIVITCNDESLIPLQGMSLYAILRYQKPLRDLAIDYLLLIAANEGHVLKRDATSKLFDASGMDIRRSLLDLNFWCQMGVGSSKAGLDWILPCWPPEVNRDDNGDRVRVLSLNTYEPYMGWYNRDLFLGEESWEKETEALKNTFHWWRLGIQDSEDAAGFSEPESVPFDKFRAQSKIEQLELLDREMDYLDMRSSLDVLSTRCPQDMFNDVIDISAPPIPESHRSNYVEAYPLLQANLQPEYPALSETLCLTFAALLSKVFRTRSDNMESTCATQMFNGWRQHAARRQIFPSKLPGFQKVFEPLMRQYSYANTRSALSFDSSISPITEDIAPYVRSIMVFDGRLKQYRDYLSALMSREYTQGEKRKRTTRASRAALEGGDKASVRKERWFPDDTNYFLVQGTGMPEWQAILFQLGHFHVQPVIEPSTDSNLNALEVELQES